MSWHVRWHPTIDNVGWVPQEAETAKYDDMCSGWYYADEAEGLNGPYGTAEAAKEALDEYVENFL